MNSNVIRYNREKHMVEVNIYVEGKEFFCFANYGPSGLYYATYDGSYIEYVDGIRCIKPNLIEEAGYYLGEESPYCEGYKKCMSFAFLVDDTEDNEEAEDCEDDDAFFYGFPKTDANIKYTIGSAEMEIIDEDTKERLLCLILPIIERKVYYICQTRDIEGKIVKIIVEQYESLEAAKKSKYYASLKRLDTDFSEKEEYLKGGH